MTDKMQDADGLEIVESLPHHGLLGHAGVGRMIVWKLPPGTRGMPKCLVDLKEKTVQISGSLVEGDLEGANVEEWKEAVWVKLVDADTLETLTKDGLYHLKTNPLWLSPVNRKSTGVVTFAIVGTH